MQKLFAAISIGLFAGVIDVIPMWMQKIDKTSCFSAFVHWIVLGVVISYVSVAIPDWAKGAMLGFFSALPIVILLARSDPKVIAPILIMSLLLGGVVGILSGKFAN